MGKTFCEEDVRTLSRAGLTHLQAKVYLTLVQVGKATIKTVSGTAGIDRSDVYRIIIKLQAAGLVEQIIGVPNSYKAVPVQDCLTILMKRKKEEYREVHRDVDELIRRMFKVEEKQVAADPPRFIIVPEKEILLKKITSKLENAQLCVDAVVSVRQFEEVIHNFHKAAKSAAARNVKQRVVTEEPENKKGFPKEARILMASPQFQVRFNCLSSAANMVIFDQKETFVVIYPESRFADSPALWTNHEGTVRVFEEHFERLWNSSVAPSFPLSGSSKNGKLRGPHESFAQELEVVQ